MQLGKSIRLERIINRETKRCIIVPLDHGVTVGPIPGLVDSKKAVAEVAEGGADAVLMHKGLIRCCHRRSGRDVGLIVHLSAGTELSPYPNTKVLVTSVQEALRLGADAVSVHVNLGDEAESAMLADLGRIAREADDWGMPLLAMIYARGPHIKDPFAPEVIAHSARVATELGADMVKVPYCGDIDSFRQVVESCHIPLVIAGGEKMDSTRAFLQMAENSIKAGGTGLSVGRNVFQHPRPRDLMRALSGIVHKGKSVDEALAEMGEARTGI
jgi:class I fructose-bisphosphate aldolase